MARTSGQTGQVSQQAQPVQQAQAAHHVDKSTAFLGTQAQALIDCNQKLKDLGIDDTIKLPQICVIGDQSAGKSSLIEAISKIQVPKADGCCTQCPVAINLKSGSDESSPWECKVVVERQYDFIKDKKATKSDPFGPWKHRAQAEIIEIAVTKDRKAVPELIQKAQNVALHPPTSVNANPRSSDTQQDAGSALFSPNVVRLDISEGIRPNLSFLDLPGVISNTASRADRHLITLVENLVRHYAKDERSVNLLALPMTADVETSRACAIIQDLEVETRTLAVFTKPDRVIASTQNSFINRFLLQDDQLRFEQGYHFVMMDNSAYDDHAARAIETNFFARTPWAGLAEQFRDRLGILALSNYLRSLLFLKTRQTLPENLEAITNRLRNVDSQLSKLPPPPNVSQVIISLSKDLSDFEIELARANLKMRPLLNDTAAKFRKSIIDNKPIVILKTWAELHQYNRAKDRMRIIRERRGVEGPDEDIEIPPPAENRPMLMANKNGPVFKFFLDDIRDINKKHRSAFVPGEIEPLAIEEMNKLSVKFWPKALDTFMKGNSTLLREQVLNVANKVLGKHEHLEIYGVVDEWIRKFVDDAVHEQWSYAEEVCNREMELPLTLDQGLLREKEQQCLEDRQSRRREQRSQIVSALADAKEGKEKHNRPEAKEDKLGPDPFDIEIQMSAKNRAYYEIAASRFVDVVCQGVFCRLVPKIREPMMQALKEHLGINDPDRHGQIITWMTEDKSREAQRQALFGERKKLQEGNLYIRNVLGHETITSPSKRPSQDIEPVVKNDVSPSKRSKLVHRPGSAPAEDKNTNGDKTEMMQGIENTTSSRSKRRAQQ